MTTRDGGSTRKDPRDVRPQPNERPGLHAASAAARQRANSLHKARIVELVAAVIVDGSAEFPRGVVLEPGYREGGREGGNEGGKEYGRQGGGEYGREYRMEGGKGGGSTGRRDGGSSA